MDKQEIGEMDFAALLHPTLQLLSHPSEPQARSGNRHQETILVSQDSELLGAALRPLRTLSLNLQVEQMVHLQNASARFKVLD